MIQALMSGVASIQAQQTRMDAIGNDLANINTAAFKSTDVSFQDLISQQIAGASAPSSGLGGTDPIQFGLGVKVAGSSTNETQGSITATNNSSDLAIQGGGFFMVSDGQKTSYTRDGSFSVDAAGNVVNSATGQKLLGWTADATGKIDTTKQLTPSSTLVVPLGVLTAAQPTTQATIGGNLSATAASTDTATLTTTLYDALGVAHDVTIQFSNPTTPAAGASPPAGATSSWQWTAYAGDAASGTAIGSSSTAGNSLAYFSASGSELSGLASGVLNKITVPASGTGSATTVGVDFSGLTQLGQPSKVLVTNLDGTPPGTLQSFEVGPDGTITGSFSNNLTRALGKIGLANFTNPEGLASTGANMFQTTLNSGVPEVGAASTDGRGSINAGFLEQSNVDLSTELTNLIVTQRAFESNTKIVTTVDTMLQNLLDMKR